MYDILKPLYRICNCSIAEKPICGLKGRKVMKKMFRALSLLICFALLVTLVPANFPVAFASEVTQEQEILAETPVSQSEETTAPEKTDDAPAMRRRTRPPRGKTAAPSPRLRPPRTHLRNLLWNPPSSPLRKRRRMNS